MLRETEDLGARQVAGKVLVALAPRAQPDAITDGAVAMISVLESTDDLYRIASCSELLSSLADQIDAPSAISAWKACWPFLGRVVSNDGDEEVSLVVENALIALIPRLDHQINSTEWQTLVDVVKKPDQHPHRIQSALRVLIALAPKLEAQDANTVAESLIGSMQLFSDAGILSVAAHGLEVLAPQLSPDQITRGADALIGVLEKSTHWAAQQAAWNGLVALAAKLSPDQISRGSDALIGVLEKSADEDAVQAAWNGLGRWPQS